MAVEHESSPVGLGVMPCRLVMSRVLDFSRLSVVAVGLGVALWVAHTGLEQAQAMLGSVREQTDIGTLVLLALVYAVALAVPFVPGMELGLLIMMVFGPPGVAVAYGATLLGLGLAFAAGRRLPMRLLPTSLKQDTMLSRRDLMRALPEMLSAGRWGRWVPRRLVAWLTSHRYLALAVCLNLPCNAVLGGGGGLAILCGASQQFDGHRFLLTIALAVCPLPILMITGLLTLQP